MSVEGLTTERLERIPLLAGFTPLECQQVQEAARRVTFQPGEVIVTQGGTSQDLWIVLDGQCEVLHEPGPGHVGQSPICLATLEPSANFGEMSFFHAAPHSACVRAQSQVRLLRITRTAFDELVRQHPSVASKLAINTVASLAQRMRRMDDWVAELLSQSSLVRKVPELVRLREQLFDTWKL